MRRRSLRQRDTGTGAGTQHEAERNPDTHRDQRGDREPHQGLPGKARGIVEIAQPADAGDDRRKHQRRHQALSNWTKLDPISASIRARPLASPAAFGPHARAARPSATPAPMPITTCNPNRGPGRRADAILVLCHRGMSCEVPPTRATKGREAKQKSGAAGAVEVKHVSCAIAGDRDPARRQRQALCQHAIGAIAADAVEHAAGQQQTSA
jgi:hypothetical protein